jgi:ribose transport system permease protein
MQWEEKVGNKTKNQNDFLKWIKKFFSVNGGILIVLILFVILFAVTKKTFFRKNNLILIMRQASTNCLLSFGMTIVMIAGSIDLSVGSIYGVCGMLAGVMLNKYGVPIPFLFAGAALCSLLFGLLNGFIVTKTSIPPFIATLGVSYISRGMAYLISGGVALNLMNDKFNQIGLGSIFGIPYTIIYMLVVMIILNILMGNTRTGRYIYARGSNPIAAKFSGIKTDFLLILVHCIAGVLAGLAGVISCARLFSAVPGMGEGSEIDSIAAVVIGGTSMMGGKGSLVGTLIGAILIAVMGNGLNHMGVSSYWQMVFKGALIIIAVGIDGLKKNLETQRLMQKASASVK